MVLLQTLKPVTSLSAIEFTSAFYGKYCFIMMTMLYIYIIHPGRYNLMVVVSEVPCHC